MTSPQQALKQWPADAEPAVGVALSDETAVDQLQLSESHTETDKRRFSPAVD